MERKSEVRSGDCGGCSYAPKADPRRNARSCDCRLRNHSHWRIIGLASTHRRAAITWLRCNTPSNRSTPADKPCSTSTSYAHIGEAHVENRAHHRRRKRLRHDAAVQLAGRGHTSSAAVETIVRRGAFSRPPELKVAKLDITNSDDVATVDQWTSTCSSPMPAEDDRPLASIPMERLRACSRSTSSAPFAITSALRGDEAQARRPHPDRVFDRRRSRRYRFGAYGA